MAISFIPGNRFIARLSDLARHRAASTEYDGGVPRAWTEGLARLDTDRRPADVPWRRWQIFVDDCGRFRDGGWAKKAAALGWGPSIYSAPTVSGPLRGSTAPGCCGS